MILQERLAEPFHPYEFRIILYCVRHNLSLLFDFSGYWLDKPPEKTLPLPK
jgi:hypothetical protein